MASEPEPSIDAKVRRSVARTFGNLLFFLLVFPRFIRDAFYDWFAKQRYQWFGRYDACFVPTPELEERFLK